ncbi:reverse transcriptase domain-containing protein [Tanacetum coccineum]
MSKSAERAHTPTWSVIRNTTGKGSKQATDGPPRFLPEDRLREIFEKHYNQLLPIIEEKVHQEKLQGVQMRLTYGDAPAQEGQPKTQTIEGRKQETLSEVMLHALVKDREKSKESGMRLMEKTACNPPELRKLTSLRASMNEADTGSPNQKNKNPLIRSARVWFETLPPESIDSYVVLRKVFLRNFLQQRKYIKDPIEIHHIKQKEGESTEAFMERFKAESMHVNGAPECMRLVDEMMSMTTTFLRGEVVVANQSRKRAPPAWKHHEASHKASFDKQPDFKNKQCRTIEGRG